MMQNNMNTQPQQFGQPQGFQASTQQPAPQPMQAPGLKDIVGTVAEVAQSGQGIYKSGPNQGQPFTKYKYKIIPQGTQFPKTFNHIMGLNESPLQPGQTIQAQYKELPNPKGTQPMKFLQNPQVTGQGQVPQMPQNNFQQQQSMPQGAYNGGSAVQIPPDMLRFVQQYKQQAQSNGAQPDINHALGTYVLTQKQNTQTAQMFLKAWNQG